MKKILFAAVLSLAFGLNTHAQLQPFEAAEYSTQGGWGTVTIQEEQNGQQAFEIQTINANGHSCSVEGSIIEGQVSNLRNGDTVCQINFKKINEYIQVTVDEDMLSACSYYCGARGRFAADYYKTPQGCTIEEINATEEQFDNLMKTQRYQEAVQILMPVLQNCQETQYSYHHNRLRNKVAQAHIELKDRVACLETLRPLAELASQHDTFICHNPFTGTNLPPVDCDNALYIAHETQKNVEACAALPYR